MLFYSLELIWIFKILCSGDNSDDSAAGQMDKPSTEEPVADEPVAKASSKKDKKKKKGKGRGDDDDM